MANTDFKQNVADLRREFKRLDDENNEIVNTAPMEGKTVMIDDNRRVTFRDNLATMQEIKGLIEDFEGQQEMKEWGAGASTGGRGNFGGYDRKAMSSLGALFADSPEFKDMMRSGATKMSAPFQVKGADLGGYGVLLPRERKDVYSDMSTAMGSRAIPGGFSSVEREAMVPRAMRKVRVRDLFPSQSTTAGLIEFFRVTGFTGDSNAATVPERDTGEFGLKPQTALSFQSDQSPVRTIAHWEAAHRNTLADTPQLQGIIDTELLYGLRLEEDQQILFGDGVGENLLGICNTAHIQTYTPAMTGGVRTGPPNQTPIDDVRRAMTKAILAYYEPTGIVVHPTDWEGMELAKDTTGGYLLAASIAQGGEQRVWRLPIVDTPAMTSGRFLVGAFGLGAKLYDREEGNIRISDSHADFFLRNAIVILAEERLALTVPRPESFVYGTFGPDSTGI